MMRLFLFISFVVGCTAFIVRSGRSHVRMGVHMQVGRQLQPHQIRPTDHPPLCCDCNPNPCLVTLPPILQLKTGDYDNVKFEKLAPGASAIAETGIATYKLEATLSKVE